MRTVPLFKRVEGINSAGGTIVSIVTRSMKPELVLRVISVLGSSKIGARLLSSVDEIAESLWGGPVTCVILDFRDLGLIDAQGLPEVRICEWPLPVICLVEEASISEAVSAMQAGVQSYLGESVTDQELLEEIQSAMRRDGLRVPAAAYSTEWSQRLSLLTSRETDVLRMAADGWTTKEISRRLGISSRTVDAHRGNILKKLRIPRLCEAIQPFIVLSSSVEHLQKPGTNGNPKDG